MGPTRETPAHTHILLRAAGDLDRLPPVARDVIADPHADLKFGTASLWEIAIKLTLDRGDSGRSAFAPSGLLDNGYAELPMTGEHAMAVLTLPPIHKDPFDRMLIAQAIAEGLELVTADEVVGRYPGPIRRV